MATPSWVNAYGRWRLPPRAAFDITICDIKDRVTSRQLEHEVGGETAAVALDRLIEGPGQDTIQLRQVTIQHYLLAAYGVDAVCDHSGSGSSPAANDDLF
jgi:hypothetical protein